jgi:hypothetical protein
MNLYTFKVFTLLILSTVTFFSCHTYYKVNSKSPKASAKSLDSLQKKDRFFILRNGDEAFYINSMKLSADQKTAQCVLEPLPYTHVTYVFDATKRKMKYEKINDKSSAVINEVHLYIHKENSITVGDYTLILDNVNKIEVLEHDRKRTTNSYVLGAIGYTVGAFLVAVIIIAATKSSCPFVSAYDGEDFSLQGEIYGGAIYPQLSRNDFLPLKMAPLADGSLQVKISNELKETQFTDYSKLWKITHSKNSSVMVDEKGNLFSISDPQSPIAASLNESINVLPSLLHSADNNLVYMNDSSRSDARNEIFLKFKKTGVTKNARLVLSLKNSYFLDLLYGELAKGFGTYYAAYMRQQKKRPAEDLLKWTKEQQLPLDISVKTDKGWQQVTSLTTIGPLTFRETALHIDLSNISGGNVEIKLGSGFNFWEIDYAAMDFTIDQLFNVEKIIPESAFDETGKSVLNELSNEDAVYLKQPSIGNVATISFRSKTGTETSVSQSYILETKGYYEHIRDFKNPPDKKFLEQFREPGSFPLFGMNLYKKIKKESLEALAKSN